MEFAPTPAFWVSLLPAPFLLYLNVRVGLLLIEVRKKTKKSAKHYSKLYHQGRALGIISAGFALLPAIVEWRIFVQSPFWAISYLIGGILGILALRMVRKGLLAELGRAKQTSRSKKS